MYFSSFDPFHLSTNGENIRILYMNGGLGNQAFQYIFARWLEIKTGEPCYLNDFYFYSKNKVHNGYEIERVFGLKPRLLSEHITKTQMEEMLWYYERGVSIENQLLSMGYPLCLIAETSNFNFKGNVIWTPANEYNNKLTETRGCIYYHGYFINVNYFKDIMDKMLQELQFKPIEDEKNKEYARLMENTNSVAVHFRTKEIFAKEWKVPEFVYAQAVEALEDKRKQDGSEEYTYFIFTDGIDYVKEHYKEAGLGDKKLVFVEGNVEPNNYIDCQLMTLCKHRIVTNSAFDYLAALIRKRREGYFVNLSLIRDIV